MSERDRLGEVYEGYRDADTRDRWSEENPGNRAIVDDLVATSESLLGALPIPSGPLSVLDLGCGSESIVPTLPFFDGRNATFVGMDILFERVHEASAGGPHDLYLVADGTSLPFPSDSFDLISLSTVISSILDEAVRTALTFEVLRVLRPGGSVLWIDMRYPNPQNRNLRPVGRADLAALFPGTIQVARAACVAPPVARRLGGRTDSLYPLLRRVAPLRSHLVATLTAPRWR